MKYSQTTYLVILVTLILFLTSCDGKKIEEAQASLTEFQEAYKQENLDKVKELYPKILELQGSFRKIDTIEFGEGEVTNDTVEIKGKTKWTNPIGKVFSNDVVFYMIPKEINGKKTYIIDDTKGFISFEDSNLYKYALKKKSGLPGMTDIAKSSVVSSYLLEFETAKQQVKNMIESNLAISGMNWETGYYSDYAHGRAVVTNNTGMNLPRIKYKVTYYKRDNTTVITTDDGTVDYSGLSAGQSKSFTWYTSYVNGARYARVDCYIDDDNFFEQGAVALAEYQ